MATLRPARRTGLSSSSGGYSIITQQHPRDGTWSAWLGGYDNAADVLYQTIKIPAGRTALQVSFYVHVYSKDGLNYGLRQIVCQHPAVSSVISPQEVWTVDNTYASSGLVACHSDLQ